MKSRLWCYADSQGWGQGLYAAAVHRGWDAAMFDENDVISGGIAFVHMHHAPDVRAKHKRLMEKLHAARIRLVPDIWSARLYDDKVEQARVFGKWMPATYYCDKADIASRLVDELRYPIISKAREGASSHNVRLLQDADAARAEIEKVFGGGGIKLRYGQRQTGYLLWQDFVAGNQYDIRVIAIGEQRLLLRRYNRDDRPMASGSGRIEPINNLADPIFGSAFAFADSFFKAEGLKWCGIDIVFDHEAQRWRLLETTVGWTLHGYFDCMFFPDGRMGTDIWDVVIDEIERGNLV